MYRNTWTDYYNYQWNSYGFIGDKYIVVSGQMYVLTSRDKDSRGEGEVVKDPDPSVAPLLGVILGIGYILILFHVLDP